MVDKRSDGVIVPQQGLKEIEERSITITSSELQVGEYSILAPIHGFGLSPNFPSKLAMSFNCERMKDVQFAPNSFGYMPPSMQQYGAISTPAKAIHVMITDDFFKKSGLGVVNTDLIQLRHASGANDAVISNLLQALGSLTDDDDKAEWPILIDTLGTALCIRMMQHLGASLPQQDIRAGRITRAVEYINDNLEKKITLEEMAAVACLSRFHFSRQFKHYYGVTPQEYVNARRVEKSLRMIRHSDAGLSLVAATCGFCSQAHMTRAIKAHTGATPGQHQRAAGRVSHRG